MNELNLMSMGRLYSDITSTVDHHEPENQAFYCLSVRT